jgi:NodT family efflux transporter outer membrane factor (OMF) lipoprotein
MGQESEKLGKLRGRRTLPHRYWLAAVLAVSALSLSGCTTLSEYFQNGLKVGPNYARPPAPVAQQWIEASDKRVRSEEADDSHWWTVFKDPKLDDLVQAAYQQNLTLREAGFRVLQNRALLSGAVGTLFPQTQTMNGSYDRINLSKAVANRISLPQSFYSQWNYGFNLAWELDFWGRFRRSIESARDELDASVENYDDVLVTLLGDVATTYVQIRTLQQQIEYARQTLALQQESLKIATAKFKGGQTSQVDMNQGQSDVSSTEALIENNQIGLRQAANRLCVLLGIPPEEMLGKLGDGPIPGAPPEVALGVPADLLRRRPDVRRAERHAAAQSAQIGVAESDLYPAISILGSFGWSAEQFKGLFGGNAFRGTIGPTFTWNILNYGRLISNVRYQDAKFQELVVNYQSTVLNAGAEVENGLAEFLGAQQTTRDYSEAVKSETVALKEAIAQYQGGLVDYNRVVLIQERLVDRQQALAQSQGQIALGLIQVYRALGGGWQIRETDEPMERMVIQSDNVATSIGNKNNALRSDNLIKLAGVTDKAESKEKSPVESKISSLPIKDVKPTPRPIDFKPQEQTKIEKAATQTQPAPPVEIRILLPRCEVADPEPHGYQISGADGS